MCILMSSIIPVSVDSIVRQSHHPTAPFADPSCGFDADICRLLMESVSELGLFTLDTEGRVASWNTGAELITQYSEAEALGRIFPDSFLKPNGGTTDEDANHLSARSKMGVAPWQAKSLIVQKSGRSVLTEITIFPFPHQMPGFGVKLKPIESAPIAVDLADLVLEKMVPTPTVNSDWRQRNRDEQLRGLADNLPDGAIYQLEITPSGDRQISYISAGIEQLLGVTQKEALTDPLLGFSMVLPEDQPRVLKVETEAIAAGTRFDCEFRSFTRDGRIKWLHARSTPRVGPDGLTVWDGMVLDITAEKHSFDALNRTRSVLNQAGKLAHLGAWGIELEESDEVNANPLWWSDETYRIFGFEPGAVIPTNELFFERVHPDDRSLISTAVQNALEKDLTYEIEHRIQRADNGEVRILAERAEIIRNGTGQPIRIIGAVSDITERHRAIQALQVSRTSLVEAQRMAGLGSWEWDLRSNTTTWSDELYTIFGRDPKQGPVNYSEASQIYSREAWATMADAAAATLKSGDSYDVECEIQRLDGSQRWIITRGAAVRDFQGRITGLRGTVQDVTERKHAERLRLAVIGAEIGTWHWNILSGELRWSDRCMEIFGIPLDEVMSYERFLSALHPDDRQRADNAVKLALETKTDYEIEFRSVWPDGSIHWAVSKGRGYYDAAGNAVRMEGAALDITGQKNAETKINQLNLALERRARQVEEANRELEAFSYSVSHDLRAPLRAIDGFSRILLDDFSQDVSEEAHEFLRDIRANTQQMGRLVDDLLAFSRVGREDLKVREVQTSRIVEECLAEVRAIWPEKNWVVQVNELPNCEGDPALLKQVWLNLLSNAFKYSSRSDPARIEIGFEKVEGDSETSIQFYVRDNGVGFDMRYAHKLFGVFQRLHRAEDYEGTGVGLAIVQRIVLRHGGRIWAEAVPNQGATFSFTLPIKHHEL